MERQDLNDKLKELGLSKKEFSELCGAGYEAINKWGSGTTGVPYWVESWLENYKKSKTLNVVIEAIDAVRSHGLS